MSQLPQQITARLIASGTGVRAQGVLVSLEMFWRGQPYYSDLLGVADAGGLVHISRAKIESDFRHDQRLFPMDYKEPLDRCDPVMDLIIRGGEEFLQHRAAVEANPLVAADVREMYGKATNHRVRSARVRVDLLGAPRDRIVVDVPLTHP